MDSLPIDEFFDAVTDVQRRRLLVRLLEHNLQDPRELTSGPWEMTERTGTGENAAGPPSEARGLRVRRVAPGRKRGRQRSSIRRDPAAARTHRREQHGSAHRLGVRSVRGRSRRTKVSSGIGTDRVSFRVDPPRRRYRRVGTGQAEVVTRAKLPPEGDSRRASSWLGRDDTRRLCVPTVHSNNLCDNLSESSDSIGIQILFPFTPHSKPVRTSELVVGPCQSKILHQRRLVYCRS